MKKLLTVASLIVALGLAAGTSAYAETKIGFVDMSKVFQSYYKTKEAETRINEASTAARKEVDERVASYKTLIDGINKLKEEIGKPELSKEAKEKKIKEYDEKVAEVKNLDRELTEYRTSREKDIQAQAVRMRNGIVKEITDLIQEKVKAEGYDIVLDRSGNSMNSVPVVLFAKDTNDFTNEIITTLNKNKPKDAAPAASASPSPETSKKK